jgi:hypothetical protein
MITPDAVATAASFVPRVERTAAGPVPSDMTSGFPELRETGYDAARKPVQPNIG